MQFECLFPMTMFLGAFAKLPKTILHLHICPSVRMEKLGSHWKDFHLISHLRIKKTVEKIQDLLKSDKMLSTSHEDVYDENALISS